MSDVIRLITDRFINDLNKKLGTSTVVALKRLDKVVSGQTAKSVRVDSERTEGAIESKVYAAGGMKFIVEGKKANTKLPMRKVGDRWELVPQLKSWKAIVGFGGSDYLLARYIAKNERAPVDVASETLTVFQELYGKQINSQLLSYAASQLGAEFKKL